MGGVEGGPVGRGVFTGDAGQEGGINVVGVGTSRGAFADSAYASAMLLFISLGYADAASLAKVPSAPTSPTRLLRACPRVSTLSTNRGRRLR